MSKRTLEISEIEFLDPDNLIVGIVQAQFNENVTDALLDGCVDRLTQANIPEDNLHVIRVPGSFEIPQAANRLDRRIPNPSGIITLGAVIRGETPHFDYICSSTAHGIQDVSLRKEFPVIFGVLTCDTIEQAKARAGLLEEQEKGHKGRESAQALLEMIALQERTVGSDE